MAEEKDIKRQMGAYTNEAETEHEKWTGQHIGYRYDVNLVPDYSRLTPFLRGYIEFMGWDDLNWLEDVALPMRKAAPPCSTATSTAG